MQDIEPSFKASTLSLQPTLYLVKLKQTISQYTSTLLIQINSKYRELSGELDIFSTSGRIRCKILSYGSTVIESFVDVHLPNCDSDFKIPFNKSDTFVISCRILNKSQEASNNMLLLKSQKHIGYDRFLEFRKKVKRLQNLTSPLNWQISHRIVIKHHLNTVNVEMEEDSSVCINMLLDGKLTIQLEELSYLSPENKLGQVIAESVISLRQLNLDKSQEVSIKFSQYLQMKFTVSKLSTNISDGLLSLRILEGPLDISTIEIALGDMSTKIKPCYIEECSFFDPQYYFLSKNLKDIKENSKPYDQLSQLTKTFPMYPHIKNQQLLTINNKSTYLQFIVGIAKRQERVRIPIYNIIKGLNSVNLSSGTLRFFIEYREKQVKACMKKQRIFLLSPKCIWNTQLLSKFKEFSIKIMTSKTIVRLDYAVSVKQGGKDSEFKKYIDKLKIRQEMEVETNNGNYIIGEKNASSIYVIEKKSQFEQIILSQHLYNQQATVQIEAQSDIISFGSFHLRDIAQETVVPLQPHNMFMLFSCEQLPLPSKSANRIYQLAYSFKCNSQSQYDLQINSYKCRMGNQALKPIDYCVFSKNPEAELNVSIRRRQYDEILEQHTTKQYVNQTVFINNNSKITNGLSYHIPDQSYEIVELEFLQSDGICKFCLQITNHKEELLDQQSEYAIKIPGKVWTKMSPVNSVVFQVIGGKKSRNRQKELTYLNTSEISLKMLDYRDSLSVKIDNQYGYSKFYDLIKVAVGIEKGEVDFHGDSTTMVVMTVDGRQLWFLLRYNEDPELSDGSRKTVSKEKTAKDEKQVDDLNKTTRMDDILKIKTKINQVTDQNRKLITKAVRLENSSTVLEQRLEEIRKIAHRKKEQLKFTKPSTKSSTANEPKIYREICACGYKRPEFMGYCLNCLEQLQKRYRIVYKKFEEKAKEYESVFFKSSIRKEKISMLEKKLKNLKNRLLMKETEDNKNEQELQQESINQMKQKIINVKNEIATFRIKSKNLMESTNDLQLNLQTKINQENRQVFGLIQQIDSCKVKIRQIQNKMALMKE